MDIKKCKIEPINILTEAFWIKDGSIDKLVSDLRKTRAGDDATHRMHPLIWLSSSNTVKPELAQEMKNVLNGINMKLDENNQGVDIYNYAIDEVYKLVDKMEDTAFILFKKCACGE